MDTVDAIPFIHTFKTKGLCVCLYRPLFWRFLSLICLILITLHQLSTHMCLLLVILMVCQICLIQREFFTLYRYLRGMEKKGFRLDNRLPITLPILNRIIKASPHIYGFQYQICQFKAMCSMAFFAFLRIGEITITSSNNQPLQIDQLSHIYSESNHVAGIKLTFQNFKHNYNRRPFSIELY